MVYMKIPSRYYVKERARISITFDVERKIQEDNWSATIMSTRPEASINHITALARRPFNEETQQYSIPEPDVLPDLLISSFATDDDSRRAIRTASTRIVTIRIQQSLKTIERDVFALRNMQIAATKEHWQFLLGNRFDTLRPRSIYEAIPAEVRDGKVARFTAEIDDPEQLSVWALAQNLKGPVMILEGTGGAGKTRAAINLAMPFADSVTAEGKPTQVLVLVNTNAAVDHITQLIKTRLTSLGLNALVGR